MKLDIDGPFGWARITEGKLCEVVKKLQDYESKTWTAILGAQNHTIALADLNKVARKRLEALKFDDFDRVLSLRLSAKERVFALKADNVAFLLWWDPDHSVCPSTLKNT